MPEANQQFSGSPELPRVRTPEQTQQREQHPRFLELKTSFLEKFLGIGAQETSANTLAAQLAHEKLDDEDRIQELEALSETDPLTKLSNRRGFRNRLDKFFRETARVLMDQKTATQNAGFLLHFDLDDFGKVNKDLGDEIGDNTLITVAECLNTVRPTDEVTRYGGEEFAGFTPDNLDAAVLMAYRLQRLIAERVKFPDPSRVQTVTIGISAIPNGITALELSSQEFRNILLDTTVDQASQAMRIGKRNNKNQIVVQFGQNDYKLAIVEENPNDLNKPTIRYEPILPNHQ